ncbi:MAG: MFS transporter [Gemmatimonadales bacterium]|nr:MFS transporter [Gemmatimonadales bacterium]
MPGASASPFASLRHRNYRLFFTGQTISLIGTWMQSLGQGWLVLQLTNSAFAVGLVSALGSLPVLLFSLPAGVYVDRTNKHRVIMVAQSLLLVLALVLGILALRNEITAWQVGLIATLVGLVFAFEVPARQSFMVDLVGKDDLMNAIALNSSAFNATRVLGPAVAGFLISVVGVAVCFLLNAASYVAVIVGLARMKLPPHPPAESTTNGWERFKEGARFALGDRRIRALIIMTAILSVFGFPYVVLMPVFARDVLHVGARGFGLLTASIGVGALVSALGLAVLGPRMRKGRIIQWAGPAFALAVGGFALSRWFPLAMLALALSGVAMVLENAVTNTLLQTLTPDALRGRVMGFWTFVFVGFTPIGSLQVGLMAGWLGAPAAVAVGAAVCFVSAVVMWRVVPEVARLR